MKAKRLRNAVLSALLAISSLLGPAQAVRADEIPYDTYNYDSRKDIIATPAAYVPSGSIAGNRLTYQGETIGNFKNPSDLFVSEDSVYIADTGNQRILRMNMGMTEVLEVITTFDNQGKESTFSTPTGICVSTNNGQLYVADSGSRCVYVLSSLEETGSGKRTLKKIIQNPKSEMFSDDFSFAPLKVAVDYADRIYVIASGKTEGIMVFDNGEEDGGEYTGNEVLTPQFTSFFGTIAVKISAWQKFWRRFSTAEQRAKQALFIPTEFTGLDIDPDGFVYTTNLDDKGQQAVKKLNPKGQDVIRKGENGVIAGDLKIGGKSDYSGASQLVDIVYRDKGIYSVLDKRRGRVFTYDSEGNILYIFGGRGSQRGTFSNSPAAIEQMGENILVLDSARAEVLIFSPTDYGHLINTAVGLRYDGDETKAVEKWQEVLKYNENFELANVGIGKAYLTAGDNVLAMKYLKLGMNRQYYSVAYKRYRNEYLKSHLGYVLTIVIVLIIAIVVTSRILKKKKEEKYRRLREEGLLV